MKNNNITYFAYGANLSKADMAIRCPGCEPLKRAILPDHRLVFRGVADIEPCEGESVQGGLYRITAQHLEALDRFESYPRLYLRKQVTVLLESGDEATAIAYHMTKPNGYAPPYESYLNLILAGCRSWDIPESYFRKIIKAAANSHFRGE